VITGQDLADARAAGALDEGEFYSQSRVVADFMLESSGDPGIFGKLAAAVAQGSSLADWLQTSETGLSCRTVDELDAEWRRWVARRYLDGDT